MKNYSFSLLTAIASIILFIPGCKKSETVKPPVISCRPIKQYTNNNQFPPDTQRYTYTNNRISQFESNDFFRYVEYDNAGKVVKINQFQKGHPDALLTMAVFYETDGKLQRIEQTAKYQPLSKGILEFVYENDLVKQVKHSEYDVNGEYYPDIIIITFTYTGKNITTQKIEVERGNTEVINLEYDNKANYFTKQNPKFLILDPYFYCNWVNNRRLLPYILSSNNVIRTSDTSVYGGAIQYSIDQNGNLKEFSIGSQTIGYVYSCGQ